MAQPIPGSRAAAGGPPSPDPRYTGPEISTATGWVAWVLLGGIVLVLLGTLHAGLGLIALFRPEVLASTRSAEAIPIGLEVLATIHLLLGAAAVVTGVGLFRGDRWARLIAIQLGCLACIVNFALIAVYPVWTVIALAFSIIVVYAVAVHGPEVAGARGGTGR
ncbi:MAG TPA: hypothetical protein VFH03_23655 [Actinoplanes sp.]|nr:hypothetical protein [Actinoplanes sp.]